MNIIGLIFLGCIGYTMASFSPFNAVSSIVHQVARMKRDVRLPPTDPSHCLISCGETMAFAFESKVQSSKIPFDPDTTSFNQAVCESHNPAIFDVACDLLEKYQQCVDKCRPKRTEDVSHLLLKSADFMCKTHYEEFKKELPCVFDACNEALRTCEPKCQQFQKKLEKILENEKTPKTPKEAVEAIENLVSIVCGYADCTMNCLYPEFKRECGSSAENLERKLMQHTIDAVKEFAASLKLNLNWPESCRNLARNTRAFSSNTNYGNYGNK